MKTMKNSKKLISAILMLAFSFVMLVTSSFAWFSMNDKVDVTGMKVSAKGDQIYLQIKETAFSSPTDDGKPMTALDFSNPEEDPAELLPTAVRESLDKAFDTTSKGKGASFIWVSNAGKDATDGTKTGDYTQVTASGYALEKSMYVRLDPTSGATTASKPLYVKSVAFAADSSDVELKKCVSVMVVCGDYAQLWKNDGSAFTQAGGDKYFAADETAKFNNSTTGVLVKVYVFFDGDNGACTLQNLAAAKAASGNLFAVNVSFSVV
jgi:hypothetical protein